MQVDQETGEISPANARPITDTLRHLRGGVFMDEASDALQELVRKVDETGKGGKIVIELTVRKISRTGAMEVADKITTKLPTEAFEDGYTAVDAYPTPVETLTTGQPKIATYRNLTQAEIDVMNLIKSFEGSVADLLATVHAHLQGQLVAALNLASASVTASPEGIRRDRAQPERWVAMARTDFQTAFMKLTRAVAQPDSPL